MKTINLYFKFQFTSLSPDAQPISLGIVADVRDIRDYPTLTRPEKPGTPIKGIDNSLSFYAEFTDFDINRCDDWVNVISKLHLKEKYGESARHTNGENWECTGSTESLTFHLKEWLKQFSDYQIQFICDCGTYDWLWMGELLDERESHKGVLIVDKSTISEEDLEKLIEEYRRQPTVIIRESDCKASSCFKFKTGVPKLPDNISPVPFDLNDLIAIKDHISPKEAFDLNREDLVMSWYANEDNKDLKSPNKHNALWDAKVIKEIYQKLK